MNENCCLCKCFTELHFFYWLLVVSYNFNRFAVCFHSFINNACRSTQNAARIKRFLRLHIDIKPFNKKNKHNKFFIMLKRNSFNVPLSIWRLSKVRTGWPYRWFWKFFWTVLLKSPRVLRTVLNIEWVQFVLQNCEILRSVRGLYDKNSASWYRFTSDVMYKKYKRLGYTSQDLLARFC